MLVLKWVLLSMSSFFVPAANLTLNPAVAQSLKMPSIASRDSKTDHIDAHCLEEYKIGVGRCGRFAGSNLSIFKSCLSPEKKRLKLCCINSKAAEACADNAEPLIEDPRDIDLKCSLQFDQHKKICTTIPWHDDHSFSACIVPIESELKTCCKQGGSKDCANK